MKGLSRNSSEQSTFFSSDPLKKDDAFYTREKEIEEIESLIPEIREKIADTRDMQEETHKKLGDRVLMEEKELEAISSAATSKKTANGHGLKNGSAGMFTRVSLYEISP